MPIELVPLCTVDATVGMPRVVGEGPAGLRVVGEVEAGTVTGERLAGRMVGHATADWMTIVGGVATIDVRGTIETDDGATVFVQYHGRSDFSEGPGAAPVYVAPRFETGDPRYAWLNVVQAVGKGRLDGLTLHYEWFEVR